MEMRMNTNFAGTKKSEARVYRTVAKTGFFGQKLTGMQESIGQKKHLFSGGFFDNYLFLLLSASSLISQISEKWILSASGHAKPSHSPGDLRVAWASERSPLLTAETVESWFLIKRLHERSCTQHLPQRLKSHNTLHKPLNLVPLHSLINGLILSTIARMAQKHKLTSWSEKTYVTVDCLLQQSLRTLRFTEHTNVI